MTETAISKNISKVLDRIRRTTQKWDRADDSVTLLAVSKTRAATELQQAWEAGLDQFGESYLNEALEKVRALSHLPLCWHFIGPIQSNKTRPIAENFSWVHSLDRLKIARRLNEQRPRRLPPLNVCIQVNISGEDSKSGVTLAELPALATEVAALPQLKLRGLMAIPAATEGLAQQRQAFARLRHALEQLSPLYPDLDTLSMGMSADLEAAIAEGATIVRVGTDIFGPRNR
jgi:pyridoxal phosphate enzyme (YggS family)